MNERQLICGGRLEKIGISTSETMKFDDLIKKEVLRFSKRISTKMAACLP